MCTAVAQVVVVGSDGGGKLWSRAGVRVAERGSARESGGGGISGSLLRATRGPRRGRVHGEYEVVEERHGEVVRLAERLREAAFGRAESIASPRGASRAERASDSGLFEDRLRRTRGWSARASPRLEYEEEACPACASCATGPSGWVNACSRECGFDFADQ